MIRSNKNCKLTFNDTESILYEFIHQQEKEI